jgi:hypothetical protein
MQRRRHTSAGFTLFEVAMVLVVTGVVVGGLWVVISSLFFEHNLNQLEKGITTTATRVRNFYRDRLIKNDSASLTNANLIQLDLIAPELGVNSPTISYNLAAVGAGTITLQSPGNCGGYFLSGGSGFSMTLINMATKACDQLVPRLAGTQGQAQGAGITAVLVGGKNVLGNNNQTYSLNPTAMETACQNNANVEICYQQF